MSVNKELQKRKEYLQKRIAELRKEKLAAEKKRIAAELQKYETKEEVYAPKLPVIPEKPLREVQEDKVKFSSFSLGKSIFIVLAAMIMLFGLFFVNEQRPFGLVIYDNETVEINETINITEINETEEIINETELNITEEIINETINATKINITNETIINITEETLNETINITNKTTEIKIVKEIIIQGIAEINKPVKWIKKVKLDKSSSNLTIEDNVIEYYTEAPQISEEKTKRGKKVVISSDIHYEDVLAYTTIPESNKNLIKLYRTTDGIKEETNIINYIDTNNNNLIDKIEWIVPHLSEQSYEIIIEISKAEHLDENRNFVEDVYDKVKARDNVWQEIPDENYLRVTFEQILDKTKDITIYARSSDGASVEVYEKDSDIKIADFGVINKDDRYKILLSNLEGIQDTFDLKIVGESVEFDYVVDPTTGVTYYLRSNVGDISGDGALANLSTSPGTSTAKWTDSGKSEWAYFAASAYSQQTNITTGIINVSLWCNASGGAGGGNAAEITQVMILDCADTSCSSSNTICDTGAISLSCLTTGAAVHHVTSCTPGAVSEISSGRYLAVGVEVNNNKVSSYVYFNSSAHPSHINITEQTADSPPQWSNNQTDITSIYSPTIQSYFNITWQDSETSVSWVWFESNFSGVSVNYSMMNNFTPSIYNYSAILPGGTHYWKSYANDTLNQWSVSDTWEFIVPKIPGAVKLYINSSEDNFVENVSFAVNISCSLLSPSSSNIAIYENGVILNSTIGNKVTHFKTYAVPLDYNITCSLINQNYSAYNQSWINASTESPIVDLEFPPAGYGKSINQYLNLTFNASIYDNINFKNCSLWHDISGTWSWNQSETITGTSNVTSFWLNLTYGTFMWNIECYDTNGRVGWGANNRTVTLVSNQVPTQGIPLLNSTSGNNLTTDNLTVYNQSTYDGDGDSVYNIINWYKDNISIMVLNMPFENMSASEHTAISDQYAYWQFEGNADDSTGNNPSGTVNLSTLTGAGKVEQAYDFNGINNSINMNINFSWSLGSSNTISFWIKSNNAGVGIPDGWRAVMGEGIYNTNAWDWRFHLWEDRLTFSHWDDTGGAEISVTAIATKGIWTHITVTYDPTNLARMYQDGELVDTDNDIGDTLRNWSNTSMIIGHAGSPNKDFFDGTIDEVQVWYRSLTAAEVKQIYEQGLESEDDVFDYSGFDNDGTVSNATWDSTGGYDGRGAYIFDGINDYIQLTNGITPLGDVSIVAWIRPDDYASWSSWGRQIYDDDYLHFGVLGSNTLRFTRGEWGGSGIASGILTYQDYEWTHVAAVYDGNYLRTYMNGELDREVTQSWDIPSDSENERIGSSFYMIGTSAFDGRIDEVRVYNRSLSQEQIQALYQNRTDLIVLQETSLGDTWQACITPRDGKEDGNINCSNNLTIISLVPVVTLDKPFADYFFVTDQYVNITFNASVYDNINLKNCSLWHNISGTWTLNQSQNVTGTLNTTSFWLNLTNTSFIWNIECYDGDSNVGWGLSNRTVTLFPNQAPTQGIPILNSTNEYDFATENLTVYNTSTYDADGHYVRNIINWYKDGKSITMLNMPFERWGGNGTHDERDWIEDYSSFGNNGTVNGATFNPTGGYDGRGAYEFDGTDYINCGSDKSLRATYVTVEAWIKSSSLTGYTTIASKWNPCYVQSNREYALQTNDDKLMFSVDSNGEDPKTLESDTGELTTGEWYHVIGTYNGSTVVLYKNGVQIKSTAYSGAIHQDNQELHIGRDPCPAANYFKGTIDEVRIYNYSLSPEQIKVLYENRTDLIVSQETSVGDVWQACITPNDGFEDGDMNCSNDLTIISDIIPTVNLDQPLDNYVNSTDPYVNITFNASVFDAGGLVNCSLWHNISGTWSLNQSENVTGTLNITSFWLNLTNTSFIWNIECYDGDSNVGWGSDNRTVTLNWVNNPPTQGIPILNSTFGTNLTIENLTVYNISTYDLDGNGVKNIINWYRNGTSITVLNMPFENNGSDAGTKDYSGYGNNGTEGGSIIWNSTGGYDGKGAYEFEGDTDILTLNSGISMSGEWTICTWTKFPLTSSTDGWRTLTRGSDQDHHIIVNVDGYLGVYDNGGSNWVACSPTTDTDNYTGWNYLCAIGEGTKTIYYVNGTNVCNSSVKTTGSLKYIGNYQSNNQDWGSYIDEFIIFNHSLSEDQINVLYENRTDLIVSQETSVGDVWRACITPNDGREDGDMDCSNNLTILAADVNNPPYWSSNATNIVSTYSPTTQSYFNITWTDDNSVSWVWFESNFTGTPVNYSMMTNFTPSIYNYSAVLPAGSYYWKSYANDSANQWNETYMWNFTIAQAGGAIKLYINSSETDFKNNVSFAVNISCSLISPTSGNITIYEDSDVLNSTIGSIVTHFKTYSSAADYNITCSLINSNYTGVTNQSWVNATSFVPTLSASIPNQTWLFNTNRTINLSEYFTDPNGDDLNWTATDVENITVLINNDTGNATFVPDTNFTGTRYVVFTAWNPSGNNATSNNVTLIVYGFSGGNGSYKDPYQITDCEELQNMKYILGANYTLINNVNCSNTTTWNNGAGFEQIGDDTNTFTGTFDGDSYNITDLYINRPSTDNIGLIGYCFNSGFSIENVGLIGVNISGGVDVGGLAGAACIINNSFTTGYVTGNNYVGGLIGQISYGSVNNSYSNCNVDSTNEAGGLAGHIEENRNVYDSYATGNVTSSYGTGGLVGVSNGILARCYATGNVNGTDRAGGLVGRINGGDIYDSYATGNVNGTTYVGGLVGDGGTDDITDSYATGNVTGTNKVGGLVGYSNGDVNNSFSTGNVTGSFNVSGLIGYKDTSGGITNSYWNNITGNPDYCWSNATGNYNIGCTAIQDNVSYFKGDVYPSSEPMASWDFDYVWMENIYPDDYPTLQAFSDAPYLTAYIPNMTWPEDVMNDTLNLSKYFKDPNGDDINWTFTDVENITIVINNATGIVNMTPDTNWNGIRYVVFTATDGTNTKDSNNITLNVSSVDDLPTIILDRPADNYINSTDQYVNITFNATVTDDNGLVNCSLWLNTSGTWSLNQSQNVTQTSNTTSFTLNLTNTSFIWNMECYDNNGQSAFNNTNRTVILNWTGAAADAYPYWSSNATNIVSTYSPTQQSFFNITWEDESSVSWVWFESNFTGSPVNYSMMTNFTPSIYNYSAVLPAGSHYWKSYANDSNNQWNETYMWNFTIAQAGGAIKLYINSSETDFKNNVSFAVNISCSLLTPTSGNITIYEDSDVLNSTIGSIATHFKTYSSAADYNITCSLINSNYTGVTNQSWVNATAANNPPTQGIPILNSTSGTNLTTDNLTVYNISTADADGDGVKNIINWYKDGTSITVLNMPFENNGSNAGTKDYSGYGNNGTENGALWNSTGGYDGKGAYEFNSAADEYIKLQASPLWNFSGPFSISVWIKTSSNPSGWDGIVTRSATDPYVWYLRFNTGNLQWGFNGDDLEYALVPTIGQWYHIVALWNSTDRIIYVNGSEVTSKAEASAPTANGDPVYIGMDYAPGNSRTFPGSIDEVIIYNHSLSAEQIKALYQNRTDLIVSQETAVGDIWKACITPNDGTEDGDMNCSGNLTILANVPPTVSLDKPEDNYVNSTDQYVNITFNATVTDNSGLVNCSLWHNISGTWSLNQSQNVTQTSNTTSFTINLTNTSFIWNIECYDDYNQSGWGSNRTVTLNWTTSVNNPPTQGIPILNSTSGNNFTDGNLTVYNTSTYDADGDSVKNIINWYKDGTSIMVLNMPFEGWSNTTHDEDNWTKDYSSFGNNGTVNSSTWNSTGGYDSKGAYEFDGVDDNIAVADSSSFDFGTGAVSFSFWFKSDIYFNGSIVKSQPLLTKYLGTSTNFAIWLVGTEFPAASTADGSLSMTIDATGGWMYMDTKRTNWTAGTWYHVVVTRDGASREIYINGVDDSDSADSTTPAAADFTTITGDFKIGGGNTESGGSVFTDYFNGTIDEFQIYNHTLSQEQIYVLYQNRTDLIVSNETSVGDIWKACITPNDGTEDGDMNCSGNLTILSDITVVNLDKPEDNYVNSTQQYVNITFNASVSDDHGLVNCSLWLNTTGTWSLNQSENVTGTSNTTSFTLNLTNTSFIWNIECYDSNGNSAFNSTNRTVTLYWNRAPTQGIPILNSTSGTNLTTDNLTVYNISTADADGDYVKNIINWYKDGTSITVVNMPFENNGSNAGTKDYSGYGNNGTESGATWDSTGGYDGKGAYNFDGVDDKITVAHDPSLSLSDFSISSWIYTNSTPTAYNQIYIKGNVGDPENTNYLLRYETDRRISGFYEYDGGTDVQLYSTGTLDPKRWYHIVLTYDSSTNNFSLYMDGVLDNSSITAADPGTNANPFYIAACVGTGCTSSYFFNGTVDELQIYNRTLSSEQVKALYQNRTDLIVSNETSVGDIWKACITPNDGTEDGDMNCSGNLTILANVPPTVSLDKPEDNYVNSTDQYVNITFNATVTDNSGLLNCSLWLNTTGTWSLNQSENVTQTSNTTSFTINLTNTSFIWNIECYDDYNQSGWGSNRTVTLNWTTSVNNPPTQGIPILNSTSGTNLTSENLTVYNISTADADGDSVKNIINWYKDGTSITVLNMPFEGWSNATHDEDNWTKDYSGHGNNGTVNGALWNSTGGYDGKGAYEFDGSDYVDVGSDSSLDFSGNNNFTIEVWAYLSSDPTGTVVILDDRQKFLQIGSDNKLIAGGYIGGNWEYVINSGTALSVNNWYHLVVTYNGTKITTYVNGSFNIDKAQTGILGYGDADHNVYVGKYSGGFNFNGTIDEVRVYNRSLSAEQVKALYQNRTDLIVSQETSVGEVWKACITPNDGTEDGDMNCSGNLTILAVPTVTITFNITKTFDPDVIVAGLSENINVTTTAWINLTTYNITYFNIIDEVPYDFTAPSASGITVTYINGSDNSRIIITDNVTINITDRVGTNNTIITVNGTNNSLGSYLFNDSIELNYLMVTSIMSSNETRAANVNATANDTQINRGTGYLAINITASQAVLRGYKQITYNQSSPGNFTVDIDIKALGGDLTDILAADYLPDVVSLVSDLLNFNITYYNSSSGNYTHLINQLDYNITGPWTGTLPGGYPASIFHYNLSYNFTNWDGIIYENDSIHINYIVTILGGGNWTLPCIIGAFDPVYRKHIKTEISKAYLNIPLFDVKLKLLTYRLKPGEFVRAVVNLLNVGGPKAKVDVFLNYAVKTMSGEIVTEGSETLAAIAEKELEIGLFLPPDLEPGKYTLEVLVTYTGREAMSTNVFEVVGEKKFDWFKPISVIVIILLSVGLFITLRKKKEIMRVSTRIR